MTGGERPSNAPDAATDRRDVRRAELISFDWRLPGRAGDNEVHAAPRADQAVARMLDRTASAIILRGPTRGTRIDLPAASVPPSLRHCRFWMFGDRLSLSAPVVSASIAFVESSYVCNGLCSYGQLYALRRDGSGWRIVAVAPTWVS